MNSDILFRKVSICSLKPLCHNCSHKYRLLWCVLWVIFRSRWHRGLIQLQMFLWLVQLSIADQMWILLLYLVYGLMKQYSFVYMLLGLRSYLLQYSYGLSLLSRFHIYHPAAVASYKWLLRKHWNQGWDFLTYWAMHYLIRMMMVAWLIKQ